MPRAEIQLSPDVTVVIDSPEGASGAATQKALIEGMSFWQGLPSVCPMPGCGAPVHFTARHPQNFHYYGLQCNAAKPHETNLGERKDGTSLYYKEDSWKDAYGGGGQDEGPASAPAQAAASAPTSPSGGNAGGPPISQATIVNIMRTGQAKGITDMVTFINQTLGLSIAGVKELSEAQGLQINENLGYL